MTKIGTSMHDAAVRQFVERRTACASIVRVRNETLPAGSAMMFYCTACGFPIIMPEHYFLHQTRLCFECVELEERGWLEEAIAQ